MEHSYPPKQHSDTQVAEHLDQCANHRCPTWKENSWTLFMSKTFPYHQTQLFILRVCSENGTVTWGSLTNLPQGMGTFEAWNQTTLEFVYAYA